MAAVSVEFDGEWYGAVVVARVPAGVKVRFDVDGTTAVVEFVRAMPCCVRRSAEIARD